MNSFGKRLVMTTFGESHGKAIGCVLDGVPAGLVIDEAFIQSELDRRRPGKSKFTTARKELDEVQILSGVFEGKTILAVPKEQRIYLMPQVVAMAYRQQVTVAIAGDVNGQKRAGRVTRNHNGILEVEASLSTSVDVGRKLTGKLC